MKKLKPDDVRGLEAETRFYNLVSELKKEVSWIKKVRKSGRIDDSRGIDFTIFLRPISQFNRDLKIPVQIKSSRISATVFLDDNPIFLELDVPIFIVSEDNNDYSLLQNIFGEIVKQRIKATDFSSVYQREPKIRWFRSKPLVNIYAEENYGRRRALIVEKRIPFRYDRHL